MEKDIISTGNNDSSSGLEIRRHLFIEETGLDLVRNEEKQNYGKMSL